ncbi:MAG: hypothetical protein KAG66_19405, partial [Methylococcales bacterium]|nr:hypothetical protein [Methylococcales bacterium]
MRIIVIVTALLIAALSLFLLLGQQKVYRYPALSFDPAPMPTSDSSRPDWDMQASGAYQKQSTEWVFRAFEPDVSVQILSKTSQMSSAFEMENIHPAAKLHVSSDSARINETITGLSRIIEFSGLKAGETLVLHWAFPVKPVYRFAVFGDSGGGTELDWGLIRAEQLGADFVLHLGDAYYDEGSVGTVGEHMNRSKIPVYVAN